jgi:hypothetical protein
MKRMMAEALETGLVEGLEMTMVEGLERKELQLIQFEEK